MADNARKRPRKSKLEPRQDIEEDNYSTLIPIRTEDLQNNKKHQTEDIIDNSQTESPSNITESDTQPVVIIRKSLQKSKTPLQVTKIYTKPSIRVRQSLQSSMHADESTNNETNEDQLSLPSSNATISKLRKSLDNSKAIDNDVPSMKFSVEINVEECNELENEENKYLNEFESDKNNQLEFERVIKPVNFSNLKSKTLEDFNIPVKYVADETESILIKQEPIDETEYSQNPDNVQEINFDENIDIKEEIDPQDFLEQCDDDIVKLDYTIPNDLECKKETDIKQEDDTDSDESSVFKKCTACKSSYATLRQYLAHLSWHGIGKNICPDCREKFSSYKELKAHLENHYNNDFLNIVLVNGIIYQCKKCAQSVTIDYVFTHWESHIDWTKKEGVVPRVDTKNPHKMDPQLLAEVLTRLQNPNKKTVCKECIVCDRHFERRTDCKRHLIEHLLSDAKRPYQDELDCQICGESSVNSLGYRKHMRSHACWRDITCDQCNKTFSDSSNLAKHRKLHIRNAFLCDTCGKKFITKRTLVQHVLQHMDSPPLHCHCCDKTFYTTAAYKKHLRNNHDTNSKKFACNRCGERFFSLREKWDHGWNAHAIRKDLTANCPVCKQAFRKRNDVVKHIRIEHTVKFSKSSSREVDLDERLKNVKIIKVVDSNDTIVVYE